MENLMETNVAPKKEWVAPELKKVDIEEITLLSALSGSDGITGS
jgi:hypothetical protein